MYKYIILLALLCNPLLAQDFNYDVKQAIYFEAEEAKVFPSNTGGDNVLLQVVGLNPNSKVGAEVTLTGLTELEIEVTKLIDFNGFTVGLYPPQNILPTEGVYLILGKPGDRYGIRARTESGIKQLLVKLEGQATPDPDPDPDPDPTTGLTPQDLQAITTLVRTNVSSLQDPVTTRYIKEELSQLSLSEVLGSAAEELKLAIRKGLVDSMSEVRPPYKDWENKFRKPLDVEIGKFAAAGRLSTGKHLSQVVKAIVEGMGSTSAKKTQNGLITMYTREGCTVCSRWEQEVFPSLALVGWRLEKIYESEGMVPRFTICDFGKCSSIIVGYMSLDKFRLLRNQLSDGTTN